MGCEEYRIVVNIATECRYREVPVRGWNTTTSWFGHTKRTGDQIIYTHTLRTFSGNPWIWYSCQRLLALRKKLYGMALPKIAYEACKGEIHLIPINPNNWIRSREATLLWVYLGINVNIDRLDIRKQSICRKLSIMMLNTVILVYFIPPLQREYCRPCLSLICDLGCHTCSIQNNTKPYCQYISSYLGVSFSLEKGPPIGYANLCLYRYYWQYCTFLWEHLLQPHHHWLHWVKYWLI